MRKAAAVTSLLALILSNALVVANKANSTGYENTIQPSPSTVSVEAIQTESDTQVIMDQLGSEATAFKAMEASTKQPEPEPATLAPAATSENAGISDEEIDLLARIVSAEAKGEPYQGQVAVAAVVLNRVENNFGSSIHDVIYAKGQFQPVRNGEIDKQPVDSAYDAAKEAINGNDPTDGALYFANMDIAERHPNKNAKPTVTIGNHTFYV
ncbi:cell wall hydrolase [Paenibacillus silviterrae]|uniref:cell wall hydrolase n=1 Tax=Paenibacillus silviterrae TaxID=3242194 RepID=UPI002543A2E8|nr:cell wall hydrolase [Paenibacillus chinjuensis]